MSTSNTPGKHKNIGSAGETLSVKGTLSVEQLIYVPQYYDIASKQQLPFPDRGAALAAMHESTGNGGLYVYTGENSGWQKVYSNDYSPGSTFNHLKTEFDDPVKDLYLLSLPQGVMASKVYIYNGSGDSGSTTIKISYRTRKLFLDIGDPIPPFVTMGTLTVNPGDWKGLNPQTLGTPLFIVAGYLPFNDSFQHDIIEFKFENNAGGNISAWFEFSVVGDVVR